MTAAVLDLFERVPPPLPLRQRAQIYGVQSLTDVELLALLVGPGSAASRAAAATLLDAVGGLAGIGRLGSRALVDADGIGPAKTARIAAAIELGQRVTLELAGEHRTALGSFEQVAAWAAPRLAGLDHEEVWLLCLDGRNALRRAERIAKGGLHGCALTPRDVLRPVVRECASAFVLVHNHPSGDPTPSPEDVRMTRAVADAGDVVGVPLLDHVVVARQGASSLLDLGALDGDE